MCKGRFQAGVSFSLSLATPAGASGHARPAVSGQLRSHRRVFEIQSVSLLTYAVSLRRVVSSSPRVTILCRVTTTSLSVAIHCRMVSSRSSIAAHGATSIFFSSCVLVRTACLLTPPRWLLDDSGFNVTAYCVTGNHNIFVETSEPQESPLRRCAKAHCVAGLQAGARIRGLPPPGSSSSPRMTILCRVTTTSLSVAIHCRMVSSRSSIAAHGAMSIFFSSCILALTRFVISQCLPLKTTYVVTR